MFVRAWLLMLSMLSVVAACDVENETTDTGEDAISRYIMSPELLGGEFLALGRGGNAQVLQVDPGSGELLFSERALSDQSYEWFITFAPGGIGTFSNRAFSSATVLSVVNDGVYNHLAMMEAGDFSGQDRNFAFFNFTLLSDGYCRFTNEFLGPDFALDVTDDAQPRLTMAPISTSPGQRWVVRQRGMGSGAIDACDGRRPPD